MKKKLFTLLTLLCLCVTGAWADVDYTVTATRVLTNEDKTCTWSAITANGGTAFQNSKTALGAGLYFVAAGKCTLNGGNSVNVKDKGEMYIEVPSASAAGTVKFTGGANDRYMETPTGGKVHMKGDSDNDDKKASLAFTSADIVDVDGTKYLKLTSKADCKFATVVITLTSTDVFPSLGAKEITDVKICGTSITASELSTLKSTKAVTVNGSSLNGMPGTITVTVANGTTTPSRSISGTSAIFTFSIDDDSYTVTVTNVNKTYNTSEGSLVYYSKNGVNTTNGESTSMTVNGITFTYPTKTFQNASSSVTIGSDTYGPIKLSTGEAVSVTFPDGKVATKLIVYGWSADGSGYLSTIKESASSSKSVTSNTNIFYATNTSADIYPSVYEYELDDWTSMYFQGAGSQPFVIMDFVLEDVPIVNMPTSSRTGYNVSVDKTTADYSGNVYDGDGVYEIGAGNSITMTIPATTKVTKIKVSGTSNDNKASTVTVSGANSESSSLEFANRKSGTASVIDFIPTTQTTTYTISSASKGSWIKIAIYGTENVAKIGATNWGTFSSTSATVFPVSGITAYRVSSVGNDKAVVAEVTGVVPANTGLLLYGNENEYTIPTSDGAGSIGDNLMAAGTGANVTSGYVLSGKYGDLRPVPSAGVVVPFGKAYLDYSGNNARALSIAFEDSETTGISSVEENRNSLLNGEFYNIAGQRVAKPTKGIYIVNGKKVIIK